MENICCGLNSYNMIISIRVDMRFFPFQIWQSRHKVRIEHNIDFTYVFIAHIETGFCLATSKYGNHVIKYVVNIILILYTSS